MPIHLGYEAAHKRPSGLMFLRVNFAVNFKPLTLETTSLNSIAVFHGHYNSPLPQSTIPPGRALFPTIRNTAARTGPPAPATPPTGPPTTGLTGLLCTAQRTVMYLLGHHFPATPGQPERVTTPYDLSSPAFANTTYTGDLLFIHDQDKFNSFISQHPPLPAHVQTRWDSALKTILWHTFVQLLRHRHAGTLDSIDSSMSVEDITALFRGPKMVPKNASGPSEFPTLRPSSMPSLRTCLP